MFNRAQASHVLGLLCHLVSCTSVLSSSAMLRQVFGGIRRCAAIGTSRLLVPAYQAQSTRRFAHEHEYNEAFDAQWEAYFKRENLDNWELRKGLNELYGHDLIPEPKIVSAALHACRRLNDVAMTIRIFEMIKVKTGGDDTIYHYIVNQCKPTLEELGINTPEELGLH